MKVSRSYHENSKHGFKDFMDRRRRRGRWSSRGNASGAISLPSVAFTARNKTNNHKAVDFQPRTGQARSVFERHIQAALLEALADTPAVMVVADATASSIGCSAERRRW